MGDRLQAAIDGRGTSVAEIDAKKILSRAAVYFILNGTTTPEKVRDATIAKLCRFLRVNRDWLVWGRGPMEASERDEEGWADIAGYAQAVGLGFGAEAQEYAETHKLKFRAESLSRKRLNASNLAVMYGRGDSMLPRIHSGDAIMFDVNDRQPRDGALYVVLAHGVNREYQVKRALALDDTVYFVADNPGADHGWQKPRRMDSKRSPIEVIGRVRWIGSWED